MRAVTLIGPGAFHLHQQDRADIPPAVGLIQPRRLIQPAQAFQRRRQRVSPVRMTARVQIERHLDHALAIQVDALHLHQHVRIAGVPRVTATRGRHILGRRGQFQHEARIEAIERAESQFRNRLVSLVHHHHRADQAQGIAQRILDRKPGIRGIAQVVGIEIGRLPFGLFMRLLVTLGREKAAHVAPVPEHLQGILVLAIAGLQHQQHDAQMALHIAGIQVVVLFQNPDPLAGQHVQQLPVGVLAVDQLLFGLAVDGLIRHDPQHEAMVSAQVAAKYLRQRLHRQKSLAPARRHLENHVRYRPPHAILPGRVGNCSPRTGQLARRPHRLPCLGGEIGDGQMQRGILPGEFRDLVGIGFSCRQFGQVFIQPRQHAGLILQIAQRHYRYSHCWNRGCNSGSSRKAQK